MRSGAMWRSRRHRHSDGRPVAVPESPSVTGLMYRSVQHVLADLFAPRLRSVNNSYNVSPTFQNILVQLAVRNFVPFACIESFKSVSFFCYCKDNRVVQCKGQIWWSRTSRVVGESVSNLASVSVQCRENISSHLSKESFKSRLGFRSAWYPKTKMLSGIIIHLAPLALR